MGIFSGIPVLGPLTDAIFGEGGMLGDAPDVPVELQAPIRDVHPSVYRRVGTPQVGGLTQAQQAVLGLYGPQATPFAGMTQPGGLMAPIATPRQIAGGQVGGPIPTAGQAQAGQAPQLFGAAPFGVQQIGGVYGLGGPLGPQLPPPPPPRPPAPSFAGPHERARTLPQETPRGATPLGAAPRPQEQPRGGTRGGTGTAPTRQPRRIGGI